MEEGRRHRLHLPPGTGQDGGGLLCVSFRMLTADPTVIHAESPGVQFGSSPRVKTVGSAVYIVG